MAGLESAELLDRIVWRGSLFAMVFAALSTAVVLVRATAPVPWTELTAVSLPFLGALAAYGFARATRRSGRPRTRPVMQAFCLLTLVPALLQPFLEHTASDVSGYPAWKQAMLSALAIAPFALGSRLGGVLGVVLAASLLPVRAPQVGVLHAAIECALFATNALLFGLGAGVAEDTVRSVRTATRAAVEASAAASRARGRARERELWDALVHDKVLGALLLAGRGGPEPSLGCRHLAAEASAALRGTAGSAATSLESVVRAQADLVGVRLDLQIDDEGAPRDPYVEEVVAAAANEALANVKRHAGVDAVAVRGRVDGHGWHIEIQDAGVGFDVDAVPAHRAGIARGILGRLHAIGGEAQVRSSPGGTTVTLRAPIVTPPAPLPVTWSEASFGRLARIGPVLAGLPCLLGLLHLSYLRHPALAMVLMVVLTVSPVLAVWWPAWGPRLPALVLTLVAASTALSLDLVDPLPRDWRTWFISAVTVTLAIVAFRRSLRWGLIGVAGGAAGQVLAMVVAGDVKAAGLASFGPQLAVIVFVWFVRKGLDGTSRAMVAAADQEHRQRLAAEAAEAYRFELANRMAHLGEVTLPLLDRIAAGEVLDAEVRRQCLLSEAAARDDLVARPLLDDQLRAALRAARARGVAAEAVADEGDGEERVTSEATLAAFRRVAIDTLGQAPSGGHLRVVWQPDGQGRLGSVLVMGPEPLDGVGAALDLPELSASVARIGQTVLIELSRP